MKIAIIGYGRMGKEIEALCHQKGHEVEFVIDNEHDWEQNLPLTGKADVAIEFSIAQCAPSNILRCFEANIPVVSGTTGWNERLNEIRDICLQKKQSLFYAPNFSIGVNVFFEINKKLAQLMKEFSEYEITIEETHHVRKADAPSGTAIRLANDIVNEVRHKNGWAHKPMAEKDSIGIESKREGDITGTHIVTFESDTEKIQIMHEAKNRKIFAQGAIMAAQWIVGKKGFFGMADLLQIKTVK